MALRKDRVRKPLLSSVSYKDNPDDQSDSDENNWSDQDFVHLVASYSDKSKKQLRTRGMILIIFCGIACSVIGVAAGYLASNYACRQNLPVPNEKRTDDDRIQIANQNQIMKSIKPSNIEDYLQKLTTNPHVGGTEAEKKEADFIADFWKGLGLKVKTYPYDVLLSFPDIKSPNTAEIIDKGGRIIFRSQLHEKVLVPDEDKPGVSPPFNAYSASGSPHGDPVYVNYGALEDFQFITEKKSINLKGKICIARYGKIFRGAKAMFASQFGCSGLIMYTDPANYAPLKNVEPFPKTWWMPGSGFQRGTILPLDGDPLTRGYPAKKTAYRIRESEAILPKIPVMPMGYDDAKKILENMDGEEVQDDWKGGLPITYHYGPGLISEMQVQMNVKNQNMNKTIYNVCAFLEGHVEPDRYVMLGNHRDAWVFGTMDPNSGTSAMMEISRAFMSVVKGGWKPRRTVMFCSWACEEYGLIGSTEWLEDHQKIMGHRTVANLNVDIAIRGTYSLRAQSTPLLKKVLYAAAKATPNPNSTEIQAGRKTVFDTWLHSFPANDSDKLPEVSLLNSGSDYAPFMYIAGVPSSDISYLYNSNVFKDLSSYPLYHSIHETMYAIKNIIDPEFKFHTAVAQMWAEMARLLSDSVILPMSVVDYAEKIQSCATTFHKAYDTELRKEGIKFDDLMLSIRNFIAEAKEFENNLPKGEKLTTIQVRQINDQIMQIERNFIDPIGLPGRPFAKHIIFAPSLNNNYAGACFPGLVDSIFQIERAHDKKARWETFKKQLSILIFMIDAASASLDVITF